MFYFYPRPPRGGRPRHRTALDGGQDISTHALREEGDAFAADHDPHTAISTHALREEGDSCRSISARRSSAFLPTPSARRATILPLMPHFCVTISTHALREEGDSLRISSTPQSSIFLPTPSARRATDVVDVCGNAVLISTHALREEGDGVACCGLDAAPISTHALREEGDLSLLIDRARTG